MVFDRRKHCIAVGYHSGKLRELAHQVKTCNASAISQAATLMSSLVPDNSVLVPIPSHKGDATYTYNMAREIGNIRGLKVIDAIQGFSRESAYEAKKSHRKSDIWFYKIEDIPTTTRIVFIDNCVATGRTCKAARRAVGDRGITISITLAIV